MILRASDKNSDKVALTLVILFNEIKKHTHTRCDYMNFSAVRTLACVCVNAACGHKILGGCKCTHILVFEIEQLPFAYLRQQSRHSLVHRFHIFFIFLFFILSIRCRRTKTPKKIIYCLASTHFINKFAEKAAF